MSARAKELELEPPRSKARSRGPFFGHTGRWAAIAAGIVLVTAGVSYGVWQQVRTHVLGSNQYQVDPAQIFLTPSPPWIRSNIKEEVLREAGLAEPLSLLDAQLTARVAGAFAAHPWIARVERVSKHFPSGLEVEVVYRRPVAMVEVTDGALPVDVDGVVLPTADFQPGEADIYPRIGGIHTSPAGLVGTPWGDAAVAGAAQIVAAFGDDWKMLDLLRVTPAARRPGGRGGVEYAFALFTRGGTRIDWGLAPGTTVAGEQPAAEKIAQLRQYAAKIGSLDGPAPQQLLFASDGALQAVPRTPVAPLPAQDETPELR
ncbi:MAG: cell division protein FtsQ/DivIB [Pirellulales bacterium]